MMRSTLVLCAGWYLLFSHGRAQGATPAPEDEDQLGAEFAGQGAGKGAILISLDGGAFIMGNSLDTQIKPFELAAQTVTLAPFQIDAWAVTNAEFRDFVRATKYKSESELFQWSFVLDSDATSEALEASHDQIKGATHWLAVHGAYWRAPKGPGSGIADILDHPATHLSHNDGLAYCRWRGMRLPTESEWEFAARGGLKEARYPWGSAKPGGKASSDWQVNIWQGAFPKTNDLADGFKSTAPSKYFAPNKFGLYNMLGNVWEWTSSKFIDMHKSQQQQQQQQQQQEQDQFVLRGASFLDSIDGKFNHMVDINARMGNTPDSASSNTGIRCAKSADGYPKTPKKSAAYRYPEPPKPKGIAGLDQEMLQKIAEEGGIEALQEFLGDKATVTTPGQLKEKQAAIKRQMEELQKEEGKFDTTEDIANPDDHIEL